MKTSFVGTLSEPIPRQRRTTLKTTASMRTHKRQESRDAQRDGPSPNARVTRGERTGTRRIPPFLRVRLSRIASRRKEKTSFAKGNSIPYFFVFFSFPSHSGVVVVFPEDALRSPLLERKQKEEQIRRHQKGCPSPSSPAEERRFRVTRRQTGKAVAPTGKKNAPSVGGSQNNAANSPSLTGTLGAREGW